MRSPIETLTYRKTLLEIIKQLEVFRDELAQAKPRLASLINFPLGQSFSLSPSKMEMVELTSKLDEMEAKALLQRPELLEADYNERISVVETRKAIARMLPGIELSVGGHTDNNSFLVNQQWIEGGARLTWNLMNLISGPSQYKIATSQVDIAQAQRLALSMSILTQVHVAYNDFFNRKRQYELSEQLQDVDARIHEQTMNQAKSGAQNHMNEIRSSTASLMAEYRSYQNYASLQSACGQIIATLGDDPLPNTVSSHEIKPLSGEIGAWLYGPGAICVPAATPPATVAKPAPEPVVKPALAVIAQAVPATAPAAVLLPPTLMLSVLPGTISKGQTAKLAWTSTNAIECSIMPSGGMIKPQGEMDVAPSETTTYTVVCNGAGGSITSDTILVVAPPAIAVAKPVASAAILCRSTILSLEFDSARSVIKTEHNDELKRLADFLKEFPEATGEISGHTDNIPYSGKNMDNIKLSQYRADSIRTYLINNFGIDPKRITAKGYGPAKPVADNSTAEGRRKNRRIETNFKCGAADSGPIAGGEKSIELSAPPVAVVETKAPQSESTSSPVQPIKASSNEKIDPRAEKKILAAKAGDIQAQVAVGWLYSAGIWVTVDKKEAARWYRLAAEKGNINAQLALGWLYREGDGLIKDLDESAKWYAKAAEQGSEKARQMMKTITQERKTSNTLQK